MKKIFYLILVCILATFSNCKSKKADLRDEDKVEIADFINFYEERKLPLELSDSVFTQKNNDTISYNLFTKFIPDSVLINIFHKSKPLFFPLGKVSVKNGETYLFTKATTLAKKAVYVLVFDKKAAFAASMPLIVADNDKTTSSLAAMDARYTITTIERQSKINQEAAYKKDVYVYNTAGVFNLIVTESNNTEKKNVEVINPIDTFAAKNRLAGDYVQDKRNFISFRDGRLASNLLFFVHFEKDNSTCKGELKGEGKIISDKLVRFSEPGSPCVIDFNFSGRNVTMKEVGGCGSYRDIKCFFEGAFTKKPSSKKSKIKR